MVRMPTRWGEFTCHGYDTVPAGAHHLALVHGDLASVEAPLVRVHSECLTGDVFGSQRCDCGNQLEHAMRTVVDTGVGAVVYLRGHEGRGIGLANKLRAYELQEEGCDTVDANLELGLPVDVRDFSPAGAILRDLGVRRVVLATNNPAKAAALEAAGVEVHDRLPVEAFVTDDNRAYLLTKQARLGHLLDVEPGVVSR